MKYRKFLMSAILTGAICLFTVLAFTTEKAEAWGWYGVSSICFYDEIRGPEGEVLRITLEDVIVNTRCYNFNSGNVVLSDGFGQLGYTEIETIAQGEGDKDKGAVVLQECVELDDWDHHPMKVNEDGEMVPAWPGDPEFDDSAHSDKHTCFPFNPDDLSGNFNKIELIDSAWIYSFTAHWRLIVNGREKNSGTDTCVWDQGTFTNGIPDPCIPFTCIEDSVKDIKWIGDALPPECQ